MKVTSKTYDIRWADLDPYKHMRHTAYYDYCTQVRFGYFADNGYSQKVMEEIGIGPILLREEGRFLREIGEGERITIRLLLAGMSDDNKRLRVRHEVRRRDEVLSALVDADMGWFDINARRFGTPPDAMVQLMRDLEPSDDFEVLPDVQRTST